MLLNNEAIKVYDNNNFYLPDKNYRQLAKQISYFYSQNGYVNIADLLNELDEESKKIIGEIESLNLNNEYNKEVFMDYINSVREINKEEQIKRLEKKISEEQDELKKIELAQKIVELIKGSEE